MLKDFKKESVCRRLAEIVRKTNITGLRPTKAIIAHFIAIIFILAFSGNAFSYVGDEYIITSLSGGLALEYERLDTQINNNPSDTRQGFTQKYYLDFKSNIINSRLLTYNARFDYNRRSDYLKNKSFSTSTTRYFLSSTLLPKSAIPFNAHATRQIDSNSTISQNTSVMTNYGFNWLGRFRTLPQTRLFYENTKTDSMTSSSLSTISGAEVKKKVGPTDNSFSYTNTTSENPINSNNKSQTNSYNASNFTDLGKNTKITAFLNRYDTATTNVGDSRTQGASLSLNSAPSSEFHQMHSYVFADQKDPSSKSTLQAYSGNVNYRASKLFRAYANLSADNLAFTNNTTSGTSTALTVSGGANYKIARLFSLGQTARYEKTSTTPGGKQTYLFSETTAVSFSDRIDIFTYGASYAAGYKEEQSNMSALMRGLDQTASVNAGSNIPEIARISLNSSYNYSNNLDNNGPDQRIITYGANASSLYLKEYGTLTGAYGGSITKSWISDLDSKSENASASLSLREIENTSFTSSASYRREFSASLGSSRYNSENVSLKHHRDLFNGQFSANFSFMSADAFTDTTSSKTVSYTYGANYAKDLTLTLHWTFSAQRSDVRQSDINTIGTSIINNLTMPLRSWKISFDHNYSLTEINKTTRSSITQIFLRLSRDFGIYF